MREEAWEQYGSGDWKSLMADGREIVRLPISASRAEYESYHPDPPRCDNRSEDRKYQCTSTATLEAVRGNERLGVYSCEPCSKLYPKIKFWKIKPAFQGTGNRGPL